MKILKKICIAVAVYVLIVLVLYSCNVIWTSPSQYRVTNPEFIGVPVMDMDAYDTISETHRRPYWYTVESESSKGKVFVVGVDHTKDIDHAHLDTLVNVWSKAEPSVALVEGRLGFLFTWFQNPVNKYGESGLVSKIAKSEGVKLYTWEPTKQDEIFLLLKDFTPEQIATFHSFRPYFSNMRHGKPANPEAKLQEYLESRTDNDALRNVFTSWKELDSIWRKDFPEIEWRNHSDRYGWPKGYLSEMANASNLLRDYHLVQTINELVNKGEVVFACVGVSHAPRIEATLKNLIK